MEIQDKAMNIREVAKFLGISNQMVYNLVSDGRLKAFKIGSATRILFSDLNDYIKDKKNEFLNSRDGSVNLDENVLSVNRLNLKKDGFALKEISLSLPKGKILSLFGPSGSGKTLLLRAIAGLENILSGSIYFGKVRFDCLDVKDRNIGFVFQDYALFPHMNVKDNISFSLVIHGDKKKTIDEAFAKTMLELKIDSVYKDNFPSELSEGIKQLVAIGREKSRKFSLLLMDEPMSQLDRMVQVEMRSFIRKLLKEIGSTVIITMNDPDDALAISDYMAVIIDGGIVQFGETQNVYRHPLNFKIMELTSRFEVNIMEVEIKSGNVLPYGFPCNSADGTYKMAYRAEEVEIVQNGIPAEIESAHFFDGSRQIVNCKLNDGSTAAMLIPNGISGKIMYIPKNPVFFPAAG